jgi:hypothetical protein
MAVQQRTWQDAELELLRSGKSLEELAQALPHRTYESIDTRRRRMKREGQFTAQPEQKQDVEAIKEAGRDAKVERLERELDELKKSQQPERLPVTTRAIPPAQPEDLWKHYEEENKRRIEYALERSKFQIKFDSGPIAISFISDQHIAPGTPVDFERLRLDAELIAQTPNLYAILGGDGVDNHIKHRPAALAARSQPHEQWDLYEWYLQIFAQKIVAIISGNHDAWSDQIAGVDIVAKIAQRNQLCYAPAEARIDVSLPGVKYKVAIRHQYRFNSSYNNMHSIKQWWRMGEEAFDIGGICHLHESGIEPFTAHGQECWACRPGAYQIMSAHSRQYGYNSARPSCPTFILFPDERRIIGFTDVRNAVKTLAAERA